VAVTLPYGRMVWRTDPAEFAKPGGLWGFNGASTVNCGRLCLSRREVCRGSPREG